MKFCRLGVLLSLFVVAACKTATIYNVERMSLGAQTTATTGAVADVIRQAGERQGWAIKDVRPGEMRGMLNRKKHTAVVAIYYDTTSFSIHYVDSTNLSSDGKEIHKAYNLWIKQLEEAIQREAAFRLR